MERTSGNRAIKMENMQGAQVAPGAGENPEMSRRGAFAAGGLALAALVAGGCGWLAMNAGKSTAGPELTAKIVDGPGSGKFAGTTYTAADQRAMYAAGIPADVAYDRLTPKQTPAVTGAQEESYVEFAFDSFSPGVPYLVACDVYLDDWAYIDEQDESETGPVDHDESGRAGFVAERNHLTRTGLVIVPDKASGSVRAAFSKPATLADNQQLATRCAWQRLDIH